MACSNHAFRAVRLRSVRLRGHVQTFPTEDGGGGWVNVVVAGELFFFRELVVFFLVEKMLAE